MKFMEAVHTHQIQKESIVQALVMCTYENLHPNRESRCAIGWRMKPADVELAASCASTPGQET
jgi:hypothetical protein